MKLDGREFSEVDPTITAAQSDYVIGHLRAAGALEALAGLPAERTADIIEQPAERMITNIFLSGRKSFILAGLLTEVGKSWTRAEADRNAARFAQITALEDIATMGQNLGRLVFDFFLRAGTSSPSSPKSSNPSDEVPGTKSADPATSASSVQ